MRSPTLIVLLIGAGAIGGPGGCADIDGKAGIIPSPGAPSPTGSLRNIEGDWDDVDAVLDIAITQSQCGFLTWHSDKDQGDRRRWYTLLTIREEEVSLDLRRDGLGAPRTDGPEAITITCKVGPKGDVNYEQLILDRLVQRFAELKGDKTAKIANPWGINQ